MIAAHQFLSTMVEYNGANCRVETFASNGPTGASTPVSMVLWGIRVAGVHAHRLRAAINTGMPATDPDLRRAVGRHLIPQTTGEVAERILRACYD